MSGPVNASMAARESQKLRAMISARPSAMRVIVQAPRLPGVRLYSPPPVSRIYPTYSSTSSARTMPRQMRAIIAAPSGRPVLPPARHCGVSVWVTRATNCWVAGRWLRTNCPPGSMNVRRTRVISAGLRDRPHSGCDRTLSCFQPRSFRLGACLARRKLADHGHPVLRAEQRKLVLPLLHRRPALRDRAGAYVVLPQRLGQDYSRVLPEPAA